MKKKANKFENLEYCDAEESKKIAQVLDSLTEDDLEIVEEHSLIVLSEQEKKKSDREDCIEVDEDENISCKICKSDVLKVRYGNYEVIAECPNCKWITDIYN